MPTQKVNQKVTITAQDTFTEWAALRGNADVSVSGTFVATVTVQRSFDGGETIKDIEQFTAAFEKALDASEQGALYRVGVKTGDFTSGTILAEISQ